MVNSILAYWRNTRMESFIIWYQLLLFNDAPGG